MNQWMPCKRRDFIRKLRNLGFDGPYSGTSHQFMIYKQHRMAIPSNSDYSVSQLRMKLAGTLDKEEADKMQNLIDEEFGKIEGEW